MTNNECIQSSPAITYTGTVQGFMNAAKIPLNFNPHTAMQQKAIKPPENPAATIPELSHPLPTSTVTTILPILEPPPTNSLLRCARPPLLNILPLKQQRNSIILPGKSFVGSAAVDS